MLLKNAMKTPIPDVWLRTRELGRPDEISIVLLRHRAYVRAALTKGHCKTETLSPLPWASSPHRERASTLGSTFYLSCPTQDLERNSASALKFYLSETTKAPSAHRE